MRLPILLVAVVCTFAAAAHAAEPPKPNVIFILIDDMGWKDLGCYGSTFYETPHIDRLAAQGMKFTNAYAACPVCSPTRASILTGKYPARLHLTNNPPGFKDRPTHRLLQPKFQQFLPLEEVTIARALKPQGYVSASMGKWHLGGEAYYPEKHGFDLNIGGTHVGTAPGGHFKFDTPTLKLRDGEYLTDRLTEEAKFLYKERKITASGHETTDTDPGTATSKGDYSLETFVLKTNHYQIELLANLDKVPEYGALVVVSFPKPKKGSGFPARVFAILP